MIFLYIILALIVIFLAVIIIRAAAFKPKAQPSCESDPIEFDRDSAVRSLQELVKCKTISYRDHSLEDDAEFEKLLAMLPELYPNVHKTCSVTNLPDRALLYRWAGKEQGEPAVFMSHYDVVPVDENGWEKPAFDGIIEDGVLWGRGTLDTKVTFNGILSAAENLIAKGFVPKNDIYFAFSGGEEINGPGAKHIVDWFEEKGITLSMVIDEGGAVVEDVFPGVKQPCAMVGIAEKGMLDLKYTVNSDGGHASAPPRHTPVGKLAIACTKVENKPFKMHLTKPALEMFDTLGRHSTFLYKLIFANIWCFKGVIDLFSKAALGEFNAIVRTTVAFTQMSGSSACNVIPPSAWILSNLRLNPEDTVDSAIEYIRGIIKDDSIELSVVNGEDPSRISRTDCEGWDRVSNAICATWPDTLVTPYLMVQCSDCRHYGRISDKVYRFSAMALTKEERRTIHGHNERITLENIGRSVEFFTRVMTQC